MYRTNLFYKLSDQEKKNMASTGRIPLWLIATIGGTAALTVVGLLYSVLTPVLGHLYKKI